MSKKKRRKTPHSSSARPQKKSEDHQNGQDSSVKLKALHKETNIPLTPTMPAAIKGTNTYIKQKVHEKAHGAITQVEQDNSAVETAHKAERAVEWVAKKGFQKGTQAVRDNLKKNSERKKAEKLNEQPADLKEQRKSALQDSEHPVSPLDEKSDGKSKFHSGSKPGQAKKSKFRFGAAAEKSPLRQMMDVPIEQVGKKVDFGTKQKGVLSKGFSHGVEKGKRGLQFGIGQAAMRVHGKVDQYGGDNSSIKAAHEVEQFAERPAKYVLKKGTKLATAPVKKVSNKVRNAVRHKFLVYKQSFLAKHKAVAQARGVAMKIKAIVRELLIKSTPVLKVLGIGLLLYAFFVMVLGPIAAALTTAGTEYVVTTTYPVAHEDITDSSAQWKQLEVNLTQRIENIEVEMPGYDEYRYDIDPMEHDPFELISYLAAMHLEFTHAQVQGEIQALFNEQNPLQLIEETETRYDSDGDPYEWKILHVILNPKKFDTVARPKLEAANTDDLYDVYMGSGGNQQAFGNPFTYNWKPYISSYYGQRENPTGAGYDFHTGLDLAAPEGTPIRSVQDGICVVSGWHNLYGNYIVIRNEAGISTLYAHCSALYASVDDEIRQGQLIAAVGTTGNSSGNHLHIEVKFNDNRVNPIFYIQCYDE